MSVAFIIPVHPPHFHYIYDLLNKMDVLDKTLDIFLVFSNEKDYECFDRKDKINKVVIPPTNTGNIVFYKKFFTLDLLKHSTYDYFIVCDAEINIIPDNFNLPNILSKIQNIYENKIIYAGTTNDPHAYRITKSSSTLICSMDNASKMTDNFSLYFWWSDLPIYKREHLPHFFSLFTFDFIDWTYFDHLIYCCYLIEHCNFTIVNIAPLINHGWSLENFSSSDLNQLQKLKSVHYGFSYIVPALYKKHREFLNNEGSFLLYHLDRQGSN
jgi:hypothetical protein